MSQSIDGIRRCYTKTDQRNYYKNLRDSGKLHGTIARAMELRAQRKEVKVEQRSPLTLIQLGEQARDEVRAGGRRVRPHVKNWEPPGITNNLSVKSVLVCDLDNGRYSNSCTFTHWTYRPYWRSCGICTPRRLLWFVGPTYGKLPAPHGWQYGRDHLGMYVERVNNKNALNRYHFDTDDLKNVSTMRASAIAHEQAQREQRRQKREQAAQAKKRAALRAEAERLGVWIGLHDSVGAGNCAAGTKSWAESHGLAVNRRYPVQVIQRIAASNGVDQTRVARAIEQATQRTMAEIEKGYCEV